MQKRICAVLLVIVTFFCVFNSGLPVGAENEMPFRDVKENDWFYSAVKKVYEEDVMKGKSSDMFSPRDAMTRAETVTLLSRLAGADVSGMRSYCARFGDVAPDSWYADYIGWGVRTGLVNGYSDNSFKPDNPIYRDEMAALINRFADYNDILLSDAPLTERFADYSSIQNWAIGDVEAMRKAGLMEGDQNGNFNPKNTLLRSEAAAVTSRLLDLCNADPVYALLDNITNLALTENNEILLSFGDADTLTKENFDKVLLRNQMGLNLDKYELIMDESELEALRSSERYGGISTGSRLHISLTIGIRNKETDVTTESKEIKFILNKIEVFSPDDGPTYEYKLLLDGTCEIVNYIDESGWQHLIIPDSLNGIKVSAIGDEAFAEARSLRSVVISEGVKTIGNRAFALCTSLEKAVIPDSVVQIKRGAFYYCSELTSVSLPAGLERIPDYMFYMCKSLTDINIPGKVVEIGAYAFNNTKLSGFVFAPGLERIGDYSFEGSNITAVVLPNSCKRLGNWAFYNCPLINKAYLNKELSYVGSGIFYNCPLLSEVEYGGTLQDWEALNTRKAITSGIMLVCADGKKGA